MKNGPSSGITGYSLLLCMILIAMFLTGCGSSEGISFEEEIRSAYNENDRLDRFYDLKEQYPDNKVILWLNRDEDRWWIINFTAWLVFLFLPDIPEIIASGGVLAIFYGIAWWIGVTLTGGGVLAVLAYLGGIFGGFPMIPPTIVGILFLCLMFLILANLLNQWL